MIKRHKRQTNAQYVSRVQSKPNVRKYNLDLISINLVSRIEFISPLRAPADKLKFAVLIRFYSAQHLTSLSLIY